MHLQVPWRTRALAARQPSRRTAKQRRHGRPAREPPEGQHSLSAAESHSAAGVRWATHPSCLLLYAYL